MTKSTLFIIGSLMISGSSFSQIVLKEPLSSRQTYYKIDAQLDISSKTVNGEMKSYWVNKSDDIVPDIQLHLYLNAFRNSNSTFNREALRDRNLKQPESEYGGINIISMTDRGGTDLIPRMKYISPDDGNADDMTVLKVDLPSPAKPGDTVFLNINFKSRLPSRIIRTGYTEDYFFVAQWFPKFGVYENAGMRYATSGAWNCHQFHRNSEFYSNHSVYDVTITIPKNYVAGSGGLLISEKDNGDGNKTLIYRAEDIVDFAWTAWPGYFTVTDKWKHITITLLLPHERKDQINRQFTAVKNALEYLADNVGPYPWPYLTFVDPPLKGSGSGGMEYTTLFTSDSFTGLPGFLHLPEMVTIHEFGHAYFMGILASNEFEEPWLDEGVNSFWENRIVDHYYGKNSGLIDHPLLKASDKSFSRFSYVSSPSRQAVSNGEYSWNYPHGTYSMMSYSKTAVILHTLMGLIGEETMNGIFREYYRRWAFKLPSGRDFINVVNEVVTKTYGNRFGPDMNWFFDETLYGTGICDYKVLNFFNYKLRATGENGNPADSLKRESAWRDSIYKSVVELERTGDIILPVEVLVRFNNGEEVTESWDGKSRVKDFSYTGKRMIDWVKIDPEYKIALDVDYINNSMTGTPDRVPVRSFTDKLISLMQFFISAITL
jgi:Peptidase family M1 domain